MSSAYLSPRPPSGLHRDAPRRGARGVEPLPLPARWAIHQGDALALLRRLPSESVQTCVTSPPYLGLRDYGVKGQLGLESRPDCLGWATGQPCGECYICHMVAIFREVRRVMRDDGVCWLNIGDSYVGATSEYAQGGSAGKHSIRGKQSLTGMPTNGRKERNAAGLPMKNLLLIPFRLALALQADGWYVRSDIIWHKRAPMPESVKDRPTKAHEYIFLLSKSPRYYWDQEAVREDHSEATLKRVQSKKSHTPLGHTTPDDDVRWRVKERLLNPSGPNLRSVWSLSPDPFPAAHFATFPKSLPELCIKAGTSERGCCPECGMPWVRVVEREPMEIKRSARAEQMGEFGRTQSSGTMTKPPRSETTGWQPQCDHAAAPVPCLVLDPFAGAGTTILVADRLGRRAIGLELNAAYVEMATRRIVDDAPLLMELPA